MMTKEQAGYLERCPDQRSPCVICRYFDPYRVTCSQIEGPIQPWATCDRFILATA